MQLTITRPEIEILITGYSTYDIASCSIKKFRNCTYFTGNQWNEAHEWREESLSELSEGELLELLEYCRHPETIPRVGVEKESGVTISKRQAEAYAGMILNKQLMKAAGEDMFNGLKKYYGGKK